MKKPMTGDRFANSILMFSVWNVFLGVSNMLVSQMFGWPWWLISGSVSTFLFMVVGIKFTQWLYWETLQTAFEARQRTQDELDS